MRLVEHHSVAGFLADVQPGLERREAEHSLLLGVSLALVDSASESASAPYLAAVNDDRGLAAAALRMPPHPLLVACERSDPARPLELLLGDVAGRAGEVDVALVPEPLTDPFHTLWSRVAGVGVRVRMRQRLHALSDVLPVATPPGRLRQAGEADREQIASWMRAFDREALGDDSEKRAREAAARRIAAGEVFLWEDRQPRAMAAWGRPTRRTVAINSVYTPPEWRGRGLATACVAELSRRLLDRFAQCVLLTDLANPTSNRIYARIGFRPLLDFALLELGPSHRLEGPGRR